MTELCEPCDGMRSGLPPCVRCLDGLVHLSRDFVAVAVFNALWADSNASSMVQALGGEVRKQGDDVAVGEATEDDKVGGNGYASVAAARSSSATCSSQTVMVSIGSIQSFG